jgi:hypothetical protein
MTKPVLHNRNTAVTLGLLAYLAGTLLLWDAYENRGRSRPMALRIVDAAKGLV